MFEKWDVDAQLTIKDRGAYLISKNVRAPLQYKDMLPAYYILGIGWSLAVIVFIGELLTFRRPWLDIVKVVDKLYQLIVDF